MSITQATAKDAARIADIWNHYIDNTIATFTTARKTVGEIEALIKARKGAFLCLRNDAELIGFATYFQFRSGPGYRFSVEHTIMLCPNAPKRTGLATTLLNALCEHAKSAGFHTMVAGISAENTVAVPFHEKNGFVQTGHMKEVGEKFNRWHDLILMQKTL